jgi:xanthine dehydrogenase YagS FAD-binding subunit
MEPFAYLKAKDATQAVTDGAKEGTAFLAGGTLLIDLMRLEVMKPANVVDITGLPKTIEDAPNGGLRIGALVPNADVAYHERVQKPYAVLSEALLAGASPQVRNLATTGGNLLQRTRCPYFRDPHVAQCNKRVPGSGCAAFGGYTRSHAVLGVSDKCIATHPSDQNVALVALDATVHVTGPKGERDIPIDDLHVVPGDTPQREHVLAPGELIMHVDLPKPRGKSHYLKVRDRASFAFALASAAVVVEVTNGQIAYARIGLGGIATKPWHAREAEGVLVGQKPALATFQKAAGAALAGAKAEDGNRFKIDLAKRTLVRALSEVTGGKR